jgi:glyoxylase-like metal-dependent hydrolase (beta-lactamase superfamily II)
MLKRTEFGPIIRFDLARRLPLFPPYWTTCYLLDDWLIDSGCASAADDFVAALADTPLGGIINTHSHEDHIGANSRLQKERELTIRAHPAALPVLADPAGLQPQQFYRRVTWGIPEPSRGRPLRDGELLPVGDYTLQVIYTPGHSADHLCLYEANRGWLFSGDLFVGGRDRALRAGYDIWGIINSLKRVVKLPKLTRLLPGCARVREEPRQELLQKIAYLEELGEIVLAAHQTGHRVEDIARSLLGRPMFIELFTAGHFTRHRLILSFLGQNQDE